MKMEVKGGRVCVAGFFENKIESQDIEAGVGQLCGLGVWHTAASTTPSTASPHVSSLCLSCIAFSLNARLAGL